MVYKKLFLLLFTIAASSFNVVAQRAEVGINGGGSGYIGDLNQFNPLKISGLNAGFFAKINFDPHWGLGLHYNYGKIKGDDASSANPVFVARNLNFKTALNEIAFIGSFNFIDIYSPGKRGRITPFIFAGLGGVIFNPKATYGTPNINGDIVYDEYKLKDLTTEGQAKPYRSYAVTIPYGAGVKFKKDDNWSLFAQIGYRTVFTDYLDDVSGLYPTLPSEVISPTTGIKVNLSDPSTMGVGVAGTQRGDSRKRDTYVFVNIGISYTFVSQKCFTF